MKGEGLQRRLPPPFSARCGQKQQSERRSRTFEGQGPSSPWLLRTECQLHLGHVQRPAVLRAEAEQNELQFMSTFSPGDCKTSAGSGVQKSVRQYRRFPGGERFLVLPTRPSFQNLLRDGHSIQAQRWTAVSQSHLAPDPGPRHPATLQRWLVAAQLCPRTRRPVRAKPSVGRPPRTPARVPPRSIPRVCRSASSCAIARAVCSRVCILWGRWMTSK